MGTVLEELRRLELKHAEERKLLIEKSLTPLREKKKKLLVELAEIEKELAALGESSGAKKKKSAAPITAPRGKPKATAEVWAKTMAEVLKEQGTASPEDLFNAARDRLGKAGYETRGRLFPKIEEIIATEGRFASEGGKVFLKKGKS